MRTPNSRLAIPYPRWYTMTPCWLTPNAQPGESDRSHCANSLSILESTDAAGTRLAAVVIRRFQRTATALRATITTAVITKKSADPGSRFTLSVPSASSVSSRAWHFQTREVHEDLAVAGGSCAPTGRRMCQSAVDTRQPFPRTGGSRKLSSSKWRFRQVALAKLLYRNAASLPDSSCVTGKPSIEV